MGNVRVLLFCLFAVIYPVQLVDPSCTGKYNTNPIVQDEPTFISSVPNGKRYSIGSGYNKINILHVYGDTPYDMGYALGKMMSKELQELVPLYFDYLEKQIENIIKIVPTFISQIIAELGLDGALDFTYEITRDYTPPWYEEELRGIADGSGVPYVEFRRMNLLPELIKASCSVIGAWDGATKLPSTLIHLRALDWDSLAPIANYATVTVYHPNASYEGYAENFHKYYKQQNCTSHTFANFGYIGLIGSLNAYSEASIGIGEKVWITKEKDITTRFGNPWTYVLRDVVQFADSIDSALTMLANAHRTCSIHLGVGSFERNRAAVNDDNIGFRGIEYSADELNVFNWEDMFNTTAHPRMRDVVYWDKHVQPSGNPCLGSLLNDAYGQIDAPTIIRNITSLAQTGDTLNLIFDYGENAAYLAFSAPNDPAGPLEAYNRVHTRLDMGKLFAEPPPKF
jgi:hypothetical protein